MLSDPASICPSTSKRSELQEQNQYCLNSPGKKQTEHTEQEIELSELESSSSTWDFPELHSNLSMLAHIWNTSATVYK